MKIFWTPLRIQNFQILTPNFSREGLHTMGVDTLYTLWVMAMTWVRFSNCCLPEWHILFKIPFKWRKINDFAMLKISFFGFGMEFSKLSGKTLTVVVYTSLIIFTQISVTSFEIQRLYTLFWVVRKDIVEISDIIICLSL